MFILHCCVTLPAFRTSHCLGSWRCATMRTRSASLPSRLSWRRCVSHPSPVPHSIIDVCCRSSAASSTRPPGSRSPAAVRSPRRTFRSAALIFAQFRQDSQRMQCSKGLKQQQTNSSRSLCARPHNTPRAAHFQWLWCDGNSRDAACCVCSRLPPPASSAPYSPQTHSRHPIKAEDVSANIFICAITLSVCDSSSPRC